MIKQIAGIVLTVLFSSVYGADPKYPVSSIPEELRKDVNVVVREDQMTFKIHSKSRSTLKVLLVVTIMNGNGKHWATNDIGYDKLTKITSFKGTAYDAQGNVIKKLRSNEIYDQSDFDGSLYSDNRFKSADLSQNIYPYTVEFEYETEHKFLYSIPSSTIIPAEKTSVQHASYSLIYPEGLEPRYRTHNVDVSPKKEKTPDGFHMLSWSFENLKPIRFEPLGPPSERIVPIILAAPSSFEYGGYAGSMNTWKEYGEWQALLIKDRDKLPESTKQKVREITKDLVTTEEKAKAIYEYLQNKTRYVSVQLGIGGLQPFDATLVDQTGYGDCKALSNYTVAMLREVGVKSYYTKINAGPNARDVISDFPSHQSNHIIVAVPNDKDTLWLECTDQSNPFGYLGTFTGDRKGLMITEEGGKLVHTTRYAADKNVLSRSADVFVEITGDATAKVQTTYSGLQYENGRLDANLNNPDDQKSWLQKNTFIPSFDITAFKMVNHKDKIPSAVVNVDLSLKRLATVSGKRLFLTPNLMNRSTYIPEKVEARKTPVVRRMAYTHIDTIRYHLPEGIYPEFLPAPVKLSSQFGEYEASFTIDQGNMIYIRKITMKKGEFPAESYNALIDFYRNLNKADNTKIVFLSKT